MYAITLIIYFDYLWKTDVVVNPSQTIMRMLLRRQDQVQYLHACLFEEQTAVIFSENPDCFCNMFYGLQQYERSTVSFL